ncbi:hypothetical protein ACFRNT_14385 [Streptomyces sp. NPDC056697]|uniref:hypothetical protein n=1 Tax=Streptomyces sp. NPDC056697 TaxID=3345915 RepID=UPI0036AD59A5
MTEPETLTRLVAERVGEGREITFRAFEAKAVDPETSYRPSRSTVWKVAKGESIKPSPELIRAFAAGLGLPLGRVQAAAARQYIGLVVEDPIGVEAGDDDAVLRVAYVPTGDGDDFAAVRRFVGETRENTDSAE